MDKYECVIHALTATMGIQFRPADASALRHLEKWKLPESVVGFYSKYEPQNVVEEGIRIWPISDMVTENEQGVPGICVMPYGYVVFASTYCGDAYCFDLNRITDGEPAIGLVSTGAVGEDSSAEEVHSMIKPVANSLLDFLERVQSDCIDQECIEPPSPFGDLLPPR